MEMIEHLKLFYNDIAIPLDSQVLATYIMTYLQAHARDAQWFYTLDQDGIILFTQELNAFCKETGERVGVDGKGYKPWYLRSFQGYCRKQVYNETLDRSLMDSALIDTAVQKLLSIIEDDSFGEQNLSGYSISESESGSATRKQKWDKLKAIDILLKHASKSQDISKGGVAEPSEALQSLLQAVMTPVVSNVIESLDMSAEDSNDISAGEF